MFRGSNATQFRESDVRGFSEPTISAGEWPQTYALDRANCVTDSSGACDGKIIHFV